MTTRRIILRVVFAVTVLAASSACSGGRHAQRGTSPDRLTINPPPPEQVASNVESEWRSQLAKGARQAPHLRFPSPGRKILLGRLAGAAARYHFQIRSVRILRPVQLAPLVVVQAEDKKRFSHDVPAILRRIDPQSPRSTTGRGTAYEGFLFKALDANGTPFLMTFNYSRGGSGAGEWASPEDLIPFPHSGP